MRRLFTTDYYGLLRIAGIGGLGVTLGAKKRGIPVFRRGRPVGREEF
jgi:hypothetical protein